MFEVDDLEEIIDDNDIVLEEDNREYIQCPSCQRWCKIELLREGYMCSNCYEDLSELVKAIRCHNK